MARRAMSLLPRWSSRVFSVELDGASLYFSIQEKLRAEGAPRVFGSSVQPRDRCYSLLVCGGDRIRRAKFYAQLGEKLQRDLPPGCHLSPMSSFLPNVKDSLIKGYFLKDTSESPARSERLLRAFTHGDPVLVCSYSRGEDGQMWTQHPWPPEDSQTEDTSNGYYVVPSEAPEYHPSALNIINSDVFYSCEEACEVLKEVAMMCTHFVLQSHKRIVQEKSASEAGFGKMAYSCGRERYGSVHQVGPRVELDSSIYLSAPGAPQWCVSVCVCV